MGETLSRLHSGDLTAVLVVFVAVTLVTVGSLGKIALSYWRRLREREMAADITQNLIERGCSPTDIVGILRAAGFGPSDAEPSTKTPPIK